MKFKTLAAAFLLSTTCAHASVLTLENVGVPGDVSQPGFSTEGYQFNDNSYVVDVSPGSPFSEATNGGHSGMYAALNNTDIGSSMEMFRIGGGLMSVENLWIHGWLGAAGEVVIEGYRNGIAVQTVNFTFGDTWEAIALDFGSIDMLSFSSHDLFLVDDINVTPKDSEPGTVTEPATPLLFAAALATLALVRKRRA
ncbi:hypothetical protein [Pseudoduganella violaceinigra]|uniref:hypothetical protein n=1 Tax=Pseudoduganella violaceinigra TaxID=246602 RepID=UPI0004860FF4|nr:hypothetical protein [Pseudoduganella violaceinigra]